MQCGVATGHEYPNSGRFLTHRCLWWTRQPTIAVVLTTARAACPAAVREIRIYRVKSGRLPSVKVNKPKSNNGWHRTLALYFEDPAINFDFALDCDGRSPQGIAELVDRTAAVMKFTGENLFAYPGSWYQGLINERYNPRKHAPRFLEAFYEKFDREGLYVMPTFNQNNMPVAPGVVTPRSFRDGSLHATVIAIHDTGLPNPGRWHGSPPNFNICHPDVQRHLLEEVDVLVAQGCGHPSFKGLCFHLTRHCMLWWGDARSGYNDYAIDAFERATGVRVPRRPEDPLRGKAYGAWLRANAWDRWLDWRCDVVTAFYAEVARRLRTARADLRLWVNSQIMMNTPVAGIRELDYTSRNDREAGLDAAKLAAAIPNLMLGETLVPADFRWRGREQFDSEADYEAQHGQYAKRTSWDLLCSAMYPIAGKHDRYFESAIGRSPQNLSCDWLKECTWRVSTINPPDFHALAYYVLPLRHQDMLGMSKGGFLIGTYGMERYLAKFAQAFCALPAVVMHEFYRTGDVVARRADYDGKVYGYVVNTSTQPVDVDVPLEQGARDLVTNQTMSGHLELAPYELRSFCLVRDH